VPTFQAKLEVKETRVKSGFHEGLGAKNHWNFRSKRLLADGCVPGWEGWGVWGQVALLQPQVPEILPEPDQWEPSTINSGVSAASRQCRGGRRSTGQIDIGYFRR
jgi:hypothetical protein